MRFLYSKKWFNAINHEIKNDGPSFDGPSLSKKLLPKNLPSISLWTRMILVWKHPVLGRRTRCLSSVDSPFCIKRSTFPQTVFTHIGKLAMDHTAFNTQLLAHYDVGSHIGLNKWKEKIVASGLRKIFSLFVDSYSHLFIFEIF